MPMNMRGLEYVAARLLADGLELARTFDKPHNGSGSSAAAIPVHTTSPMRVRFQEVCYALFKKREIRVIRVIR